MKKRGIDWNAVGNFMGTINEMTAQQAFANLRLDAGMYGWNGATRTVIAEQITLHFKKGGHRG